MTPRSDPLRRRPNAPIRVARVVALGSVFAGAAGLALAAIAGCSASQAPWEGRPTASESPVPAARLQHVVLVELADKADLAAMRADSDRLIPRIATVRTYACGTPVDIGRGNVARDYDLGLVVTFDSVEDYRAYLADPLHEELVAKWRPRWRRSYIVDFAP
ncbi:MAG: Stress responsive Barrel Domain [Planctomycetota bacterium]|jgi:hypothetical protein